ncbi:MAG: WD40/YVTN/BNR-like repeat-containing protein [Thermodesulfobacteriota bacterium]
MRRTGFFLSAVICIYLYLPVVSSEAKAFTNATAWEDVTSGISKSDLRTVVVNPKNSDIAYTGSSAAVYKTRDRGITWNEVLTLRGKWKTVNFITIDPLNTDIVYAGTRNGLYKTRDQGENWERIFKGAAGSKGFVSSVAINPLNPEIISIGTGEGLFYTEDGGKRWHKDHKLPSEAVISAIKMDPSNPLTIYAATERGLYKNKERERGWERIFTTSTVERSYGDGQVEEDIKPVEMKIKTILIDPSDTKTVYIGTSQGLFITQDAGVSWEMAKIANRINHLAISPKDLDGVYAATDRGVFRYSRDTKSWEEIYKGITSIEIRFLAFDPDKYQTLWAAAEGGIFKTVKEPSNEVRQKTTPETEKIETIFANEPSIREIQEAAIRYAEVHPEKIERWRKAAKRKAWLPDLKVSYDKDKDTDWQSSTYFYSTSKEKYTDDDITEGRDYAWAWSVSLTWELGDLLWNNDQTSIDTRSRLMVQLRDDVLNEVTRLYFERKRLLVDILFSPPENIKAKVERELRLQELTADIDALTGFYLSRRLKSGSEQILQ